MSISILLLTHQIGYRTCPINKSVILKIFIICHIIIRVSRIKPEVFGIVIAGQQPKQRNGKWRTRGYVFVCRVFGGWWISSLDWLSTKVWVSVENFVLDEMHYNELINYAQRYTKPFKNRNMCPNQKNKKVTYNLFHVYIINIQ